MYKRGQARGGWCAPLLRRLFHFKLYTFSLLFSVSSSTSTCTARFPRTCDVPYVQLCPRTPGAMYAMFCQSTNNRSVTLSKNVYLLLSLALARSLSPTLPFQHVNGAIRDTHRQIWPEKLEETVRFVNVNAVVDLYLSYLPNLCIPTPSPFRLKKNHLPIPGWYFKTLCRMFTLTRYELNYYANADQRVLKGTVALRLCTRAESVENGTFSDHNEFVYALLFLSLLKHFFKKTNWRGHWMGGALLLYHCLTYRGDGATPTRALPISLSMLHSCFPIQMLTYTCAQSITRYATPHTAFGIGSNYRMWTR